MDSCKLIVLAAAGCGLATAGCGLAVAAQPPGLYDVSVATSMPNLDENLRYATRTQRQCLDPQNLSAAFWMLREPALQDCRLVKTRESAEALGYVLSCDGGHGTTGTATWQLASERISGTLDVRLGGKNMTFYQRVTGKWVASCGDAAPAAP